MPRQCTFLVDLQPRSDWFGECKGIYSESRLLLPGSSRAFELYANGPWQMEEAGNRWRAKGWQQNDVATRGGEGATLWENTRCSELCAAGRFAVQCQPETRYILKILIARVRI